MSVYIFRAVGVNRIKVGVSNNVERRLDEVRSLSPVPIEVVDVLDHHSFFTESSIHGLLFEHRSHGEWFVEDGGLEIALRYFRVVRSAAARVADILYEHIPEEKRERVMHLLAQTDTPTLLAALNNLAGQSVMDGRYGEAA